MRYTLFLLCVVYAATSWLPARAGDSASRFIGTWYASQTFGPRTPDAPLELRSNGDTWTANAGKLRAQAATQSGIATLRFPDASQLRITVRDSAVSYAAWIQPATAVSPAFAIPVRLRRVSANRWTGMRGVLPVRLRFTLYISAQSDGTVGAVFRNPEANLGAELRARTLTERGDDVVFHREGAKDINAGYDARSDTLTMTFDGTPGAFTFARHPQVDTPRYAYRVPAQTGDGWKTAGAASEGFDPAKLAGIVDAIARAPVTSLRSPYVQSLLLARHGRLVLDEYFNGFDRNTPHDVRSAGKSVTTLLVGRAIADGAPVTPETSVAALFPQYLPFANTDARKSRMTLGNLMSMTSGLACDDNDDASPGNEGTMQSQTAQPDWYKYTLDLPMASEPGAKGVYCSATINLLGGVVSRYKGEWLPQYFDERFAAPMQFRRYAMWLTPPPLDTAYMAGGDEFLPRDFLKFGQLVLNRGTWNGRRVIPDAWLQASFVPRTAIEGEGDEYGYGWHLTSYDFRGKHLRAINAGGNGGQLLYVFPDLDITIMITAANYNQYPVWKSFQTGLVPSVLQTLR